MNASTFTARVVASTGADCAAALSSACRRAERPAARRRPRARAQDARSRRSSSATPSAGSATRWTAASASWASGTASTVRDPRAGVLRRTARELGLDALRGGRGARARGARRAAGAQARSGPCDQRGVLVGGRCSTRRRCRRRSSPACSRARAWPAGRAHPRAEARGAAHQAVGEVRRPTAQSGRRRGVGAGRLPGFRRIEAGGMGRAAGRSWQGVTPLRQPPDPGGTRACAYFGLSCL